MLFSLIADNAMHLYCRVTDCFVISFILSRTLDEYKQWLLLYVPVAIERYEPFFSYLDLNKTKGILQTFWNAFSCKGLFGIWYNYHWSLLPGV